LGKVAENSFYSGWKGAISSRESKLCDNFENDQFNKLISDGPKLRRVATNIKDEVTTFKIRVK
jgi:hypothetical protein